MDYRLELLQRKRLAQIVVHADFKTSFTISDHGIGSQGDDRNTQRGNQGLLVLANRLSRVKSVHDRHVTIHENQVKRSGLNCIRCVVAVIGDFHAMTEFFQHSDSHFAIDRVILSEQDAASNCLW